MPACFKTDWAAANTVLFDYILDANQRGDEQAEARGLKWYLLLADVLLRGKRRGGRRGSFIIAARFQAWRDGKREWLLKELLIDRSTQSRLARSGPGAAQTERAQTIQSALELIEEGQLSRAARTLLAIWRYL